MRRDNWVISFFERVAKENRFNPRKSRNWYNIGVDKLAGEKVYILIYVISSTYIYNRKQVPSSQTMGILAQL